MSRIADAFLKAGHPEIQRPPLAPVETLTGPLDGAATVAAPWNFTDVDGDAPRPRPVAVHRASAPPAALRRNQPEFIELVQRVFRPATAEPIARVVMLAPLGDAVARRPVSLEIARTLASYGTGTVCVVDASGGASALHHYAGVPPGPGLSDALLASGPVSSFAVALDPQISLVPAGEEACATPGWLPDALSRAVRQLSARFDFLIMQGPPIAEASAVAAMLTLAPAVDGVLLTIDIDRTRRDAAGDIVRRLRASGVTLLGAIVVNGQKVDPRTSSFSVMVEA
ncbi:MAG: hypothetical protein A3F70_09840 [Acidobacteria bacterium RIFCSPLOWO2_12_FULL_67_14]|nr:MAG: hypothetical protein A3F70_09840 [Acidobacteria bacterium RIFCSPLOWO2_12_FULL_67_14]